VLLARLSAGTVVLTQVRHVVSMAHNAVPLQPLTVSITLIASAMVLSVQIVWLTETHTMEQLFP
jgi:hypothetical protein